jgi:hypothetical protein
MPNSIFDHINNITINKIEWKYLPEEDRKTWNSYMVNRILSMNREYIDIVNFVQQFNWSNEHVYTFYLKALPQKKHYNKFIKPREKSIDRKILKAIAMYNEISEKDAIEIANTLSESDINTILQVTGELEAKTTKIKSNGKSRKNR